MHNNGVLISRVRSRELWWAGTQAHHSWWWWWQEYWYCPSGLRSRQQEAAAILPVTEDLFEQVTVLLTRFLNRQPVFPQMPGSLDQTELESWNAQTDAFVSSGDYLAPKQESQQHTRAGAPRCALVTKQVSVASWTVLTAGSQALHCISNHIDRPRAIRVRGRQQEP